MPSLLISEYSAYASRHEPQTRRWPLSSSRSLLLSAPRCANAASSLNFWWSSSRSFLFIVCFSEPLYCRALAQPFETSIKMMPYIAERLVQPLADLSQCQVVEIEQLERSSLHLGQILERRQKMREIESHPNFALNVIVPW